MPELDGGSKTTSENAPLPRRAPADRRQRILDAARIIFGGRSLEEVPIAEIVKAAGVAHGTFYSYFPTKQAVLQALAHELVAELNYQLKTVAASQTTLLDFLRVMQGIAMQTMQRYVAVLPLIDPETMFFGEENDADSPKVELLKMIEDLILRDQVNGAARLSLDAGIIARIIVSGLDRCARDIRTSRPAFTKEHYSEQMLTFFRLGLQ